MAYGWRLVLDPCVVRRALKYAVVVGALLVLINHGDAIMRGDLPAGRLIRIGITFLVPYAVSTLSSVEASRPRPGPDDPASTRELAT